MHPIAMYGLCLSQLFIHCTDILYMLILKNLYKYDYFSTLMNMPSYSSTAWFLWIVFMAICSYLIARDISGIRKVNYGNGGLLDGLRDYGSLSDGLGDYGSMNLREKSNGVPLDSERGLRIKEASNINTQGMLGKVASFSRLIRMRSISLIETLKSFNNSIEIPANEMDTFVRVAFQSLMLLAACEDDEILEKVRSSLKATNLDYSRRRPYTPKEVETLIRIRDSIVGTRNNGIALDRKIDAMISELNDAEYSCANLMSNPKNESTKDTKSYVTDGMGSIIFTDPKIDIDSRNIFTLKCTNQRKTDLMDDLIDVLDMEVDKGRKGVHTLVNFYLNALLTMNSVTMGGYMWDSRTIKYGHHGPFAVDLMN